VRRIIDLWVSDPSKVRFESDEEYRNFLQAVGYAVMYGTFSRDKDHNTTGVVNVGIDRELEITVAHFRPEEFEDVATYAEHAKFYRLDEALDGFRQKEHRPPFVMGGIPRQREGKVREWEWHS
jgi:hypothetical protein